MISAVLVTETAKLDSVFTVGDWQVDPLTNTLTRCGESMRLEHKAVWVLQVLARRAGDIVTRQELYEEVWRGRPVTDEVLSRCISLLRGALGDSSKTPAYIQTIPRVGYRLVAAVSMGGKSSPAAGAATHPERTGVPELGSAPAAAASARERAAAGRLRRVFRLAAVSTAGGFWIVQGASVLFAEPIARGWGLRALSALMVLGCAAVVTLAWLQTVGPRRRRWFKTPLLAGTRTDYALMAVLLFTVVYALQRPAGDTDIQASSAAHASRPVSNSAIAVLPFENVSAEAGTDYFSDGLTDELVTSLARVHGLNVMARASSFALKDSAADVRALGERLGVSKLVSGTVRVDGRKLRVSVQLVDTVDGFELWSQSYDATLDEIFTVQDQIARSIVTAVVPRLNVEGVPTLAAGAPPTRDNDAYVLYLRARHMLKRREEEPIRHAAALLEEAIALDPTYAAAYIELARAHALLPYYSDEREEEMFGRAQAVIASGRARGAPIGDGAEGLAAFMAFRSWNWSAAEEGFRKALAFDPNDPDVYQWYSQFKASVGKVEHSLELATRAKELDALSPVVNDRLAVAYLWADRDDLARRQFEEATLLGLGPAANPRAYLVLLLRQHRYQEALALMHAIQKRLSASTEWVAAFVAAQEDPQQRGTAVRALAEAERGGRIKPRYLLGAWIYLGEYDRAMAVAMALLAEPASLDVEFLFAREAIGFRQHAGFGALVAALGLDRYWDTYGWPSQCRREAGAVRCTS